MKINKKNLKNKTILVIGDIILDEYIFGEVKRISPEAPVPILNALDTDYRLGGAANVALNCKCLGCNVDIISVTGNDKEGNILGQHEGYPFYTIGQRRGLNIPMGKPVYVTHIDPHTNTITIGEKEDLMETTLIAKELNFVKYDKVPNAEMEITGAIRYNDSGAHGIMTQLGEDELKVHFPAGREAITPGQAIVCYEGDDIVAGGWIKKVNVALQHGMDSLV